ncbi:hypothetical protein GGI19_002978 [Coemansia pectinata]|uniref:Uncharacterized protein n=1 Tax=Coemansia pectinata TaxID=1052879 RepID=A0A9W8H189_9FUNG|nr:hypothetical protein GGI19_002978 [Coemansia pectinata]
MGLTHIYTDHMSPLTRSENYDSNRHLPALFAVIISTASVIGFILSCITVWYVIRTILRRRHGPKPVFGNTWVVTQSPNLPYRQPQTAQVGQPWTAPAGHPWTAPAEQSHAIAANQPQTALVGQPRTTVATSQM